jgi:exopolysaccharide biosynthesis polyprenyl glycosylphosphotransferase
MIITAGIGDGLNRRLSLRDRIRLINLNEQKSCFFESGICDNKNEIFLKACYYSIMKKLELIFTALLVPFDYLTLLLAGTLAYFLRFGSFLTEIRPVIFDMSYNHFFKVILWVAIAWIIIFAISGLYSVKRHSIFNELSKIFIACSASTLIIVVAFFFNFNFFSSRLIILTSWILSIILIGFERLIIHYAKKIFYKKGIGVHQVVIIGNDRNAQEILNEFSHKPSFGYKIVKHFFNFDQMSVEELKKLAETRQIDDVILADLNLNMDQKNQLVNFCLDYHLNYKYVASLLDATLINFELTAVAGVPLIEVKQTRLDGWGRILKRIFDIILSILIIIILSPFLLIIGLVVVLSSKGPMIVKLDRIGSNGSKFKIYKFRSMIKGAHSLKTELKDYNERSDGPLFKMKNDPRLTNFGRFIRKWSLDELLQLFNVLGGTMSLVGPRPHEPEEVAQYQSYQKKLLAIKPGITGMAQVSGRSDLSWDEEVRLDSYYVENWSLSKDIQILLKTPKAVFSKRQAD